MSGTQLATASHDSLLYSLIRLFFAAEKTAHRLLGLTTLLIGHLNRPPAIIPRREVSKHRRAASLNRRDYRRRIHRQHHAHGSHAGVAARIGGQALVEGDGVRIAEPAAKIGLQAPSTRREVGPYSVAVFSLEDSAEADDFPNSTP